MVHSAFDRMSPQSRSRIASIPIEVRPSREARGTISDHARRRSCMAPTRLSMSPIGRSRSGLRSVQSRSNAVRRATSLADPSSIHAAKPLAVIVANAPPSLKAADTSK